MLWFKSLGYLWKLLQQSTSFYFYVKPYRLLACNELGQLWKGLQLSLLKADPVVGRTHVQMFHLRRLPPVTSKGMGEQDRRADAKQGCNFRQSPPGGSFSLIPQRTQKYKHWPRIHPGLRQVAGFEYWLTSQSLAHPVCIEIPRHFWNVEAKQLQGPRSGLKGNGRCGNRSKAFRSLGRDVQSMKEEERFWAEPAENHGNLAFPCYMLPKFTENHK